MRAIELFAGAGGMAIGTERAGFRHEALVEFEPAACETLRSNRPCWPVLETDVIDVDFAQYAGIDLLTAGAPCQPFSTWGRRQGAADRRDMFPEVLRAVHTARPRALLIENVRGMLVGNARAYFDRTVARLGELGYDVWSRLVNCADHGAPQRRERVFIVGFRRELGVRWEWPSATHGLDALLHAQWIDGSYWSEHGLSMPDDPPMPRHLERLERLGPSPSPSPALRWRTVRDALVDLQPPGSATPIVIRSRSDYGYSSMHTWDEPAMTIMTGWDKALLREGSTALRYLTIRQLARLQTFPDSWTFSGGRDEQLRQIGNAVPAEIAYILAGAIAERLASSP